MSEWHRIAKDLIDQGEPHHRLAVLFGVSQAMISKIARIPRLDDIEVPAWVHAQNRHAYRVLVQERDEVTAAAWARKVQMRSCRASEAKPAISRQTSYAGHGSEPNSAR